VVLQHLEESTAELVIGGELHRLPVSQVDRYWFGDYQLLLLKPPAGRLYMRVGDRSPDVGWLRQQIEAIQGVDMTSNNSLLFDEPLRLQVLAFQRSRGLLPDGVVGKHTLIHLNSLSARPGIPRLSAEST